MKFEVGEIVEGKVTGIAKFGAFVELCPGKSGLVYISEIANTFVKEVSDHLKIGDEVKAKIVSIDDAGRINLSIKQAIPPAPKPVFRAPQPAVIDAPPVENEDSGDAGFEDKLKRFMKDSESRLSDIKHQSERHGQRRRR